MDLTKSIGFNTMKMCWD